MPLGVVGDSSLSQQWPVSHRAGLHLQLFIFIFIIFHFFGYSSKFMLTFFFFFFRLRWLALDWSHRPVFSYCCYRAFMKSYWPILSFFSDLVYNQRHKLQQLQRVKFQTSNFQCVCRGPTCDVALFWISNKMHTKAWSGVNTIKGIFWGLLFWMCVFSWPSWQCNWCCGIETADSLSCVHAHL